MARGAPDWKIEPVIYAFDTEYSKAKPIVITPSGYLVVQEVKGTLGNCQEITVPANTDTSYGISFPTADVFILSVVVRNKGSGWLMIGTGSSDAQKVKLQRGEVVIFDKEVMQKIYVKTGTKDATFEIYFTYYTHSEPGVLYLAPTVPVNVGSSADRAYTF